MKHFLDAILAEEPFVKAKKMRFHRVRRGAVSAQPEGLVLRELTLAKNPARHERAGP
jgi:hypothetical protein